MKAVAGHHHGHTIDPKPMQTMNAAVSGHPLRIPGGNRSHAGCSVKPAFGMSIRVCNRGGGQSLDRNVALGKLRVLDLNLRAPWNDA